MRALLAAVHPLDIWQFDRKVKDHFIINKKPKLKPPFKVFLYATQPRKKEDRGICIDDEAENRLGWYFYPNRPYLERFGIKDLSGKVAGECTCLSIEEASKNTYRLSIKDFKLYDDGIDVTSLNVSSCIWLENGRCSVMRIKKWCPEAPCCIKVKRHPTIFQYVKEEQNV